MSFRVVIVRRNESRLRFTMTGRNRVSVDASNDFVRFFKNIFDGRIIRGFNFLS